jgi:hypothetical protein
MKGEGEFSQSPPFVQVINLRPLLGNSAGQRRHSLYNLGAVNARDLSSGFRLFQVEEMDVAVGVPGN